MMNPTIINFERDASADFDNDTYCKMVVHVEETDVKVFYTLTDENGIHRYTSTYTNMHFMGNFIPRFGEMFSAFAYADESVTPDGWMCVSALATELSNMF